MFIYYYFEKWAQRHVTSLNELALQHLFDSKRHFDITNYNNACEVAAANGHVECLQLLVENNYPMGKHTAMKAAINGHEECFYYAMRNGSTCTKEQIEYWTRYYIMLGPFDKIRNMCRILSHNMPTEMLCTWAAEYGRLDMIKDSHGINGQTKINYGLE